MMGFGAYPNTACFDPTRPQLLPYAIDDFQESACKINMLVCGNTTCGDPNAAAEQASSGAVVIDPSGSGVVVTSPANCPAGSVWNAQLAQCAAPDLFSGATPWIIAGIAVFGLVLMMGGKR